MQRAIGRTGIGVYPIGLGAMPLSIQGRPGRAQAEQAITAALDAGIDFIDTANVYCLDDDDIGHNERLIGEVLRRLGVADRVTVATKGGLCRPQGRWEDDGHPQRLRAQCEQSLRDLGSECIALYQLHAPDESVPFEDQVGELLRLREAGWIRHIGLSNVRRAHVERAQAMGEVASVQNRLNAFEHEDLDNGLLDWCGEQGIAYIPFSPVGGGNGHHRIGKSQVLSEMAHRYGASPYQVVLAWELALGPQVLPIPGASRPESVRDSAGATAVKLAAEDMRRITAGV